MNIRANKLVVKTIICSTQQLESSIQAVLDSFLGCLIIYTNTTELKNNQILTLLILKLQDVKELSNLKN
jgi:hypothetical protein